jgi:hypothetical protein
MAMSVTCLVVVPVIRLEAARRWRSSLRPAAATLPNYILARGERWGGSSGETVAHLSGEREERPRRGSRVGNRGSERAGGGGG